jgi:hypothetical protein
MDLNMRVPSATSLLLAWERGLDLSLTRRSLELLDAALPQMGKETLARLPIGKRDAFLLSLRQLLFGNDVAAISQCPECGDTLDLSFGTDEIRVADDVPEEMDSENTEMEARIRYLSRDGYDVAYRLPTSADILAVTGAAAQGDNWERSLLQCCIVDVKRADQEKERFVTISVMPGTLVAAIGADMAEADPQAEIELALECPGCGHTWQALFDIAAFLWSEIHSWAQRTLHDVHVLARTYGWREADILGMTPSRRQIYLELAQS